MSPVVHSAVGLLGWHTASSKKNLKTLIIFILIGNFPDIDFTFYLFLGEKALDLHQHFTHNVFFVVAAAIAFFPLLKTKRERLGFFLVALSHLLLDFFTIDGADPRGFRLFYPISQQLYNHGIFPNLIKDNWAEVFSLHNLLVLCLETVVFLVPIFIVYRKEFKEYVRKNELWKN